MANKPNTKSMYVRAVPRARQTLKRLLADMAAYEDGVTQEVFVTAAWLWMGEMEAGKLYAEIAPHLKAIREALKDEPEIIKAKPKPVRNKVKMRNPPEEGGGSKTG